ncbi:MAG: ATP-dependent helicase HrpB, partial [Bacteroidales bacterium]|nr:ATP-dependent helicase HrpB [Bacteroidales bacterium]
GRITPHGRALAAMPCHPRIGQMLLVAVGPGMTELAADIAALLEEKDPLAASENDAALTTRLDALQEARRRTRGGRWGRILQIAEQYRRLVAPKKDQNRIQSPFAVGALLARAYPERVAKARGDGPGRFQLATGELAAVSPEDPLSACEWLAVASVNIRPGGVGRIFLAAPLDPEDVPELIRTRNRVAWDGKAGAAVAQRERRIGGLLVDAKTLSEGVREQLTQAICEAARKEGTAMLDFSDEVGNLQRRVAAVAAWHPELELPDLSTEAVLQSAPQWLPPFVGRATTVAELKKINLTEALWTLLNYVQQQAVERLAPSHIAVPTGSRIRVEYRQGAEAPVLRVRLQECFGLLDTPQVDDGRRPVLMELLSPGYKPVQLTSDLRSFWSDAYFEVRKELRRRYPRHAWPDNPLEAEAVRGVRKKG